MKMNRNFHNFLIYLSDIHVGSGVPWLWAAVRPPNSPLSDRQSGPALHHNITEH